MNLLRATTIFSALVLGAFAQATQIWTQWSVNGHYYKVIYVPQGVSWSEADIIARQQGGHLATLTTSGENDFVYSLLNDSRYFVRNLQAGTDIGPWIGYYQPPGSNEPSGGWTWVTGESSGYTKWRAGEPNNSGGNENYACYAFTTGAPASTWNDLPKGDSPRNSPQVVSLVVESPYAPGQWSQWSTNGHWYKPVAVPIGIRWTDAQAAAALEGGYLATPTSTPENDFIFGRLQADQYRRADLNNVDYISGWIGLWQPENAPEPAGGWLFSSGEPSNYRLWRTGEPNNFLDAEDFANYRHPKANFNGFWNDFPNAGYPGEFIPSFVIEMDTAPTLGMDQLAIHDMGMPSGYTVAVPTSINSTTQIVGTAGSPLFQGRAWSWTPAGGYQFLGGNQTYPFSNGLDLSDNGHVAGLLYDSLGRTFASYWATAPSSPNPIVLGGSSGVNDNGRVCGTWQVGQNIQPWYWSSQGGLIPVVGPTGFDVAATSTQVSAPGEFVGTGYDSNPDTNPNYRSRAVIWDATGTPTNIGVLAGDDRSSANDINASGVVCGTSGSGTSVRPFKYTRTGGISALPLPQTYVRGEALRINDGGFIVGRIGKTGQPDELVTWTPSGKVIFVQASLLNGQGWTVNSVTGINATGKLCGVATINNQQRAVYLEPNSGGNSVIRGIPTTLQLIRGSIVSGLLPELFDVDQSALQLRKGLTLNQNEAPIMTIVGVTSPWEFLTAMNAGFTLRVNATSLQMTIEAYDWLDQSWSTLDQRLAPTVDTSFSYPVNPANFLRTGTREVRLRISLKQVGPAQTADWKLFIDQVKMTGTP